ncbi:helix-turn-helix domain-containing protein [uncultured Mitsuokella sp.]|uniref:helix-turn-helix domain-containing protein n=1 Tax=uncultured Mitsuokella sp. TaxID=453120 RepID=UPI00266B8EFB|nr:helix-turn-helix domain-containing protein [uncultured Mitsuokella sp.]
MNGHSRKYKIMLTNEERNQLKEVLRSNKTCNTIKKRCQILLALDCNTNPDTTYRNCAYYLGVSLKMVCNIVKLYCESGLQRTLTLNRNVNSDNATRKIDGAMEARIIAMACGAPPEGYARWTIKLLTDHARVELGLTAGEEAVRRMLKKTHCALT